MKLSFSPRVHRALATAWLIAVFAQILALVLISYRRPILFTTDLFALLPPSSEQDLHISTLSTTVAHQLENQVAVLFEGLPSGELEKAADIFEKTLLANSPFFISHSQQADASISQLTQAYGKVSKYLVSARDIEKLSSSRGIGSFLARARASLYSPLFNRFGISIEEDPFLLASNFLTELAKLLPQPDTKGRIRAPTPSGNALIARFTIRGSPFNSEVQEGAALAFDSASSATKGRFPTVVISRGGLIWLAANTANHLNREIAALNIIALIGSFVLFGFVFRSFGALLITLVPLAIGALGGLVTCLLFFPSVHAVTIGFGSVLVGGCTDYGVHYLTSHISNDSAESDRFCTLRETFSGLSLGMLTSLGAFAAFLFTPLPALLQISLFAGSGLLGAYASVVAFFPYLSARYVKRNARTSSVLGVILHRLTVILRTHSSKRTFAFGAIAVVILSGLMRLQTNDDVRLLTKVDPSLLSTEQRIQSLTNSVDPGRFVIVEGENAAQLLERETAVRIIIRSQEADTRSLGITDFVPSPSRARESAHAIDLAFKANRSLLISYAEDIGLPGAAIDSFCKENDTYSPGDLLDTLLSSSLGDAVRLLWLGKNERGNATTIRLSGQPLSIKVISALTKISGVAYVDRVGDASRVLKLYRTRATFVTTFSYLAIFILLSFRYGFRHTCRLMLAPFLGALFALACLGLSGGSINLFSIFGILITLGLGIDFTLFIEESCDDSVAAETGVVTSALTSILSFGLLAFTSTPILNQFGISISMGIFVAMVVAPLTATKRRGA